MKRSTLVASLGLFCTTLVAHAAPSVPAPPPAAVEKVNPGLQLTVQVEAATVPTPNKCGEARKGKVKLTNKSGKVWLGQVGLKVGSQQATKPVELAATGGGATQTVEVSGPTPLDCKKPLGHNEIWVKHASATTFLLAKQLSPSTVTLEQSFSAPGYGESRVWLRRVYATGGCGAAIVPSAWLQGGAPGATVTNPPGPQQAKLKLGFGSVSKELSVTVPQNAPTTATLDVPAPFDCQGAAGIPPVDYALLTGVTASGKVDASEVVFE